MDLQIKPNQIIDLLHILDSITENVYITSLKTNRTYNLKDDFERKIGLGIIFAQREHTFRITCQNKMDEAKFLKLYILNHLDTIGEDILNGL